ncbi:MAG: altronate dehydratase family protein [Alphaproteobacteria bacterium]|jgi:altronate hydrolase|nr:altronate dehydratase family protein [Alphaproteobacteria bacterium]MDP6517837.1 altronate dehydratase family protein [Alphaproteobacteria bacterium]
MPRDAHQAQVTIRLHKADNVVTAKATIPAGMSLDGESVAAAVEIPVGHKIATAPIGAGEAVRKYDQIIGFASQAIAAGDHVHIHNVSVEAFDRDYDFGVEARPTDQVPETERATFEGIIRADGRIATRNYIGVLTSVNCSATVARAIADGFRSDALGDYPNVDGVVALTHGTGCGMAGVGLGWDLLQATLDGYKRHPNFAAVLMVGLGCEVNQVAGMMKHHGWQTDETFHAMTIQDTGGTVATVREGIARIKEMLPGADTARRVTVPAAKLILGLECGGSDAYSGITANPSLGAAADLLVRHGGTATLAETPEIYGAEHLLTRRAISRAVGEKLIAHIRWWEDYTTRNEGEMNNNPSPGNKAGGLTTILEKSLGAVAKGGTTNLVDVYQYGEPITAKGFTFMNTPGYDVTSVNGMVAGGANVVCFTTGRGSVFGCKPVPSMKLATNTAMYNRMSDDMDINCGAVVDGDATVAEMGQAIFKRILRVASGQQSKSEVLGFGDEEFVPWQIGAVM